jgi:hypothetical protein
VVLVTSGQSFIRGRAVSLSFQDKTVCLQCALVENFILVVAGRDSEIVVQL